MKKYFIDTNILLRFLLKDNKLLFAQAEKYLKDAERGEIQLILLPTVLFEIDYVLRGVYLLKRKESAELLSTLAKTTYLQIDHREIFIRSVEKYKQLNIDLFDIYLYFKARAENAEVLSFDKDFRKLKNSA
ncbi:hypothetical protein COV53_04005 [Candidatus Gottesmanbacteria bacterium CG11_big_fil_rev_8_21_14_0_20_37_11]|uniref:PIN domain-containing protein n=3 Tax=Candidatus Gottesmaniibacteriota TaxID=1752720 RepID=A0A2M7RRL4_9BACT|nr:MAG: hypothetical protein AUJ73_00465 [Candidatus Gottesmanbacteria bacterium CG1_02_37_22]PIP32554.1 MAG: hypothetical protein COX23_04015 [Candidatus Gottesmanbacteria bacterium CG23_combo_of_CG06-09_8_20_14_all_37_19]PIR08235.1 MAG: hypothetical protein COV53_04005 [Candidatus Gottesmanbacteria bacterium CG11_big_fil_rev_8_21_14_0_20_37_11]PIZ02689.1 MAG: hypothetical protein COY59_03395 [Candidatus Gottesmanbacteria bacterium CG_4_10_14_0_8_um_filter_37_24]